MRRVLRSVAVAVAAVVALLAAAAPEGPVPAVAAPDPSPTTAPPPDTGPPTSAPPPDTGPPSAPEPQAPEPQVPGPTPPAGSSAPAGPDPPSGHRAPERPTPPVEPGPTAEPTPPAPPAGSPLPAPVRPPGAGRRAPGADYAWPLHPTPAVATPFRRPSFRFGRGHRGADLIGEPGQAVLAAREGTVVFAGRVAGRPVVSVDHPDGLRTTYEPVIATVRVGDRLTAGDPIGVLVAGHTGCTGAACLHWGVRRGKVDYLDPLVLVRPPRVRLLPWDGA